MSRNPLSNLGPLAIVAALVVAIGPLSRSVLAHTPKAADVVRDAGEASHASGGAASHGTSAPHGGEDPNLLEFKLPLAVATALVFVGLLAILRAFAWKPLLKALHDREHNLEHTLQETEKARDEAARLLAEHKAELAKAADQVKALLDEARRDAAHTANEIVQKAQAEAEAHRARAAREIETAKDAALTEIWSKSADLAVAVASRVLPRELSADDHRRLVEQAIRELPAGNGHGGRS